jgi:hypothetical protein
MFDAAGASRARFDVAAAEPTPAGALNLRASLVKEKASK